MSYVGWPTKVNRNVLSSTDATVGENATKEDSLETGKKRSKLTVSNAPKKFNVSMRFNYVEKDSKGLTEKDRFWNWYERVLHYSVNEFQFPDLMYGIDSEKLCWYRITGAVNGTKSGLDQEIKMTWESSYEGEIEADEDPVTVSRIEAVDGAITVFYSGIPAVSPTTNSFGALLIDGVQKQLTGIKYFDGDRCYLYFVKLADGQNHEAHFSGYPELTDSFTAASQGGN
ncbi:MAG: hypothetical protein J6V90_07915 [Treponema sp.]|nr:hypothetical protein [Treponema sp.]